MIFVLIISVRKYVILKLQINHHEFSTTKLNDISRKWKSLMKRDEVEASSQLGNILYKVQANPLMDHKSDHWDLVLPTCTPTGPRTKFESIPSLLNLAQIGSTKVQKSHQPLTRCHWYLKKMNQSSKTSFGMSSMIGSS